MKIRSISDGFPYPNLINQPDLDSLTQLNNVLWVGCEQNIANKLYSGENELCCVYMARNKSVYVPHIMFHVA